MHEFRAGGISCERERETEVTETVTQTGILNFENGLNLNFA